jgi:hypothetical protein
MELSLRLDRIEPLGNAVGHELRSYKSAAEALRREWDDPTHWRFGSPLSLARDGVARALGLAQDKAHGIWVPGPGSYGRNDAGDAGIDAALLSKALGRPVRVQGMRWEGHGWDPKGPASIHRARAALDKDGAVIGDAFESKGFSRIDIDTNESDPAYSLAGQLMGLPLKPLQGFGVPAESYGFTNKRLAWETIAVGAFPLVTKPCRGEFLAGRGCRRGFLVALPSVDGAKSTQRHDKASAAWHSGNPRCS